VVLEAGYLTRSDRHIPSLQTIAPFWEQHVEPYRLGTDFITRGGEGKEEVCVLPGITALVKLVKV